MSQGSKYRGYPNAGSDSSSGAQIRYPGPPSFTLPTAREKEEEAAGLADLKIDNIDTIPLSRFRDKRYLEASNYVVRLKSTGEGITSQQRIAHIREVCKRIKEYRLSDILGYKVEARITNVFSGYIAYIPYSIFEYLSTSIVVARFEPIMRPEPRFVPSRSWLNARMSLKDADFAANPKTVTKDFTLNGNDSVLWEYNLDNNAGKGVRIYVVDCDGFVDNDFGRDPNRIEYRASWDGNDLPRGGFDPQNPYRDIDLGIAEGANGSHATVVANIAGGDTYGYAPKANMWVFGAPREDFHSFFILAVFDRIASHPRTSWDVLNLSWGAARPRESVMNDALQGVIRSKVIVVVAAGNKEIYMPDQSVKDWPANADNVIVVGATDGRNRLAWFSNYGPLIDVYAPGILVNVKDRWEKQSGTSFSAPLVSGFIARLLSDEDPKAIADWSPQYIKQLLWQYCSRITDTYQKPDTFKDPRHYPIRCLTAIIQPKQGDPVVKDAPCEPMPRDTSPDVIPAYGDGVLRVLISADTSQVYLSFPRGIYSRRATLTFQQWRAFCSALSVWPSYRDSCYQFFDKVLDIPTTPKLEKRNGETAEEKYEREKRLQELLAERERYMKPTIAETIKRVRSIKVEFEGSISLRETGGFEGSLEKRAAIDKTLEFFKWVNVPQN